MMKPTYSIQEWQQGYHLRNGQLQCNYCNAHFASEQTARMFAHLQNAHGGPTEAVLTTANNANALTTRQRELLLAFAAGTSDQELATTFNVTSSTIRHQKFTFRQKAAQARLYLAQYQNAFHESQPNTLLRVPAPARTLHITTAESAQTCKQYLVDGQISRWPRKEKLRVILCLQIIQAFDAHKLYSYTETTSLLKQFNADYSSLARYLVDYDLLARTPDGQHYWRIFN